MELDMPLLIGPISANTRADRGRFVNAGKKRRRQVLKLKSEDFEQGYLVKVQGHMLSKIEVRGCVLAVPVLSNEKKRDGLLRRHPQAPGYWQSPQIARS